MGLARIYIQIGGREFDVERFNDDCLKNGVENECFGKYFDRVPGVLKHPAEDLIKNGRYIAPLDAPVGEYFLWVSKHSSYSCAEVRGEIDADTVCSVYRDKMIRDKEDAFIVDYLKLMKSNIPNISEYVSGDFFVILQVIYSSEDGVGGGHYFSDKLIRAAADMGAGIDLIFTVDEYFG